MGMDYDDCRRDCAGIFSGSVSYKKCPDRREDGKQQKGIDISGPGDAGGAEAQAQPVRRMNKSRTTKKVACVCGVIAEYLQTDPSVVRLVTVVLMLGWGSGLLAYIICALVLPEE